MLIFYSTDCLFFLFPPTSDLMSAASVIFVITMIIIVKSQGYIDYASEILTGFGILGRKWYGFSFIITFENLKNFGNFHFHYLALNLCMWHGIHVRPASNPAKCLWDTSYHFTRFNNKQLLSGFL